MEGAILGLVGWHSTKKTVLSVMKKSVSMACGKRGREVVVKEDTSAKQVKPVKSVAVGRWGVVCMIHYMVPTGEKDYFLRANLLLGDMYEKCKSEEELQDDVLNHGPGRDGVEAVCAWGVMGGDGEDG